MKLRILLTGKNGQLGWELQRHLPWLGDVIALDHNQLDLADPGAIRRTLQELRPHLIVNAAAYTDVNKAETDYVAAQAANGDALAVMAEEAKRISAALVHYSTDYVFDGTKSSPYEEADEPNPINAYGKTKLAGERAIHSAGVPHLILRTSWVYATRRKNFLLTFLRLASQKEELPVVEDQIGSPTWSRMVGVGTRRILAAIHSQEFGFSRLHEFSGIYHLTAAGETSWCDFARAILEECSDSSQLGPWFLAVTGGQPLPRRSIVPVSSSNYPTPARRPAYSVLSNNKLRQVFGMELPHWRSQLRSALREAETNDVQRISITRS